MAEGSLDCAMRRILLTLVLAALMSSAFGQICVPELRSSLTDLSSERPSTGIDAVLLLKRAVELIEPGLPPTKPGASVPLDASDAHYEAVLYLAERRLLPSAWSPDKLDRSVWQAMINSFLGWYKAPTFTVHESADVTGLLLDTAKALDAVSRAVRPAALIASDPDDPQRIAFWAIIWNWTSYPRLLVFRPRPDVSLADGPRAVLPALGNCAVQIRDYITAPAEMASKLFLATNQSRMYVVGSAPGRTNAWPYAVAEGEELAVFGFDAPAVAGLSQYSAVFDGPEVGIGTVIGLLPRLRTNMSPTGFMSFMQTP